jgi:myo-inositol-1(or 4)-monophosphatase
LAEEGGLTAATGAGSAGYRWLVDPLDGTTNFAHTFPMFCISIGLEYDGEVILGVVYDPVRRELWEARRGRGATLNRRRIRVSPCPRLGESLLVTGFAYDLRDDPTNLTHFANFSLRARGIRRTGSAALDLCYTATGRLDGFWELKLQPWDIAAGSLIVTEAGGRVTDCAGRPFRVDAREIVASNGRIHQEMVDMIRSAPAHRGRA